MRRILLPTLLAASCAVTETPPGSTTEALYGQFLFNPVYPCTPAEQQLITAAWDRGRRAGNTPEFEACLRSEMVYVYQPCVGYDPFWDSPRSTQADELYNVARSVNPVVVGCGHMPGRLAETSLNGGYSYSDAEAMLISSDWLDELLGNEGVSPSNAAWVAGAMWHEAMHNHGYMHNQGNAVDCGYPDDSDYHSANEVVDRCIVAGALANGVALEGTGTEVFVGPGEYRTADGTLPNPGVALSWIDVAPSISAVYCATDASGCLWRHDPDVEPTIAPETAFPAGVAHLTVAPLVTVYDQTLYGGHSVQLAPGRYGMTQLAASIGNDAIRSIWVPAGLAVYACSDDGGSYGAGTCRVYRAPVADTAELGGISYLEIFTQVTLFADNDFFAGRQSFGYGAGTTNIGPARSVIVPSDLTARVCSAAPGVAGQICHDFTNSATDLGPDLAGLATYVEVTPRTPPWSYRLWFKTSGETITIPGLSWSCGSWCMASFAAGSALQLTAAPLAAGGVPTWTGCDSVANSVCTVSMTTERSVSVSFTYPPPPSGGVCNPDCADVCDGLPAALYVRCMRRCGGPSCG
jgi:hypothetical protein